MSLDPVKQKAFLMAISSFRAVHGSYDLETLRELSYQQVLSDQEWRECLELYHTKLLSEKKRNEEQQKDYQQIKAGLQSKIEQLRTIVQTIPEIIDVFIVNSYTLGALKPTSDIDLLVITHPQAIWLARLKLTICLELTGLRRKPGQIEEHFCLSFFITTDHLDMAPIAHENDIHFAYWAAQAEPLFPDKHLPWLEKNTWLKSLFPYKYSRLSQHPSPTIQPLSFWARLLNQLIKIPMQFRAKYRAKRLGPESSIIINDHILKFHNIDRRKLYKERTAEELSVLEQLIKVK